MQKIFKIHIIGSAENWIEQYRTIIFRHALRKTHDTLLSYYWSILQILFADSLLLFVNIFLFSIAPWDMIIFFEKPTRRKKTISVFQ